MSSEIASLEREYVIVTRLYSIARNYDIPIEAEENALYKTLMPSFQHLKVRYLTRHGKSSVNSLRRARPLMAKTVLACVQLDFNG